MCIAMNELDDISIELLWHSSIYSLFISHSFRYHSPSYHSRIFLCYLTWGVHGSMNKWSIICSTFSGTKNLLHFTPFFVFISSLYHTIFSFLPSHFSSMEQMLMLMLIVVLEYKLHIHLLQIHSIN